MAIDFNYDLIALWRSIDEVLPYRQYNSGAKDNDNPAYKNALEASSNPVLALEYDIINKDGYGLSKGFYEIAPDETYNYLMFIQSNKIKAKIPVIKQESISTYGMDFEWPDDKNKKGQTSGSENPETAITVASKKAYKQKFTEEELKKRKKKYKKGQDPAMYFHSRVYLEYKRELDAYEIIWEKYNTRLYGVIKI